MAYRNLRNRIFLCSVLAIALGSTVMSASARTVLSPSDGATSSVSGERYLRGEFIRLSKDRELVTSVGRFDIPAAAKVIDHRGKGDERSAQTPQVSLKFRNDYLVEVTIY